MEAIVKYKANDGTEFLDRLECEKYESLIKRVDHVMSPLVKIPDTIDFANGHGYIQQDDLKFKSVRMTLLHLMLEYVDHKWIRQSIDDDTIHPSWVARYIGDTMYTPLYKAWHRISCTDEQFREWGQPYYRNHPEAGDQKQLNGGDEC